MDGLINDGRRCVQGGWATNRCWAVATLNQVSVGVVVVGGSI